MNEKLVVQFSADIEVNKDEYYNGDLYNEEAIANALEDQGFDVRGCCWKATWTLDGYDHCKPPIASD